MFNENRFRLKVNMYGEPGSGVGGLGGQTGATGHTGDPSGTPGGGGGQGQGQGGNAFGTPLDAQNPTGRGQNFSDRGFSNRGSNVSGHGAQSVARAADAALPSGMSVIMGDMFFGMTEAEIVAALQSSLTEATTAVQAGSSNQSKLAVILSFAGKFAKVAASFLGIGFAVDMIGQLLSAAGANPESMAAVLSSGNLIGALSTLGEGDFGTPGDMGGPGDYPEPPPAGGPEAIDTGGGGTLDPGTGAPVNPSNDPLTYDFWDAFVNDYFGENSVANMFAEDDAFRKEESQTAIGNYQAALSDLTNQANTGTGAYTPTIFGMGDFRTSFVPKSGLMTADDLSNYAQQNLTSQMGLIDIMQPNRGTLDYMNQLAHLAQFDRTATDARAHNEAAIAAQRYAADQGVASSGIYAQSALDQIDAQNEDSGSWLDAIRDISETANNVYDIWKYW